jgi:hypothetical protein
VDRSINGGGSIGDCVKNNDIISSVPVGTSLTTALGNKSGTEIGNDTKLLTTGKGTTGESGSGNGKTIIEKSAKTMAATTVSRYMYTQILHFHIDIYHCIDALSTAWMSSIVQSTVLKH